MLERSTKSMSTGYCVERQQANEQAVETAPIIPCASVLWLPRSIGKEWCMAFHNNCIVCHSTELSPTIGTLSSPAPPDAPQKRRLIFTYAVCMLHGSANWHDFSKAKFASILCRHYAVQCICRTRGARLEVRLLVVEDRWMIVSPLTTF
jgi:hypothetical protein